MSQAQHEIEPFTGLEIGATVDVHTVAGAGLGWLRGASAQ